MAHELAVNEPSEDTEALVARIESAHPRWGVWRSIENGRLWWATVRENLTRALRDAGCVAWLCAADTAELEQLLAEQDALAGSVR